MEVDGASFVHIAAFPGFISSSSAQTFSSILWTAEEEALFADVDALDPESNVEAVSNISAPMRGSELEPPMRTEVGKALALEPDALVERSVEELGAALGARAKALEAQLKATRAETDKLTAQLSGGSPPKPSAARHGSRETPTGGAMSLPEGGKKQVRVMRTTNC